MSDQVKNCSKCQEVKSITEFNKNKERSDGLQTYCKICSAARSRKYYADNIVLHSKNVRRITKKNVIKKQQFVYNYAKENGCIDCGENDPVCLDFDHQRDKVMMISSLVRSNYSLQRIKEEIEKCEVRCANCHRKKTAKDFNWYSRINKG